MKFDYFSEPSKGGWNGWRVNMYPCSKPILVNRKDRAFLALLDVQIQQNLGFSLEVRRIVEEMVLRNYEEEKERFRIPIDFANGGVDISSVKEKGHFIEYSLHFAERSD